MSDQSWSDVVKSYMERIQLLQIPIDPTPAIINQLISNIDALYMDMQFNYASLISQFDYVNTTIMTKKKLYYLAAKDQGRNEKEREAIIYQRIAEEPIGDYLEPFDALADLKSRGRLMELLLKILSKRADRLITSLGALKLEVSLTNNWEPIEDSAFGKVDPARAQ